jgi:hypothetical protein
MRLGSSENSASLRFLVSHLQKSGKGEDVTELLATKWLYFYHL